MWDVRSLSALKEEWLSAGWVLELNEAIDPYGVVGVAGPLTVGRLVDAYSRGIFPWPHDEELVWFCPPQRGILRFEKFHVNRRLLRSYRNCGLTFTRNKKFQAVMEGCASAPRRDQNGTWITVELKTAFKKLHDAGYAHSFEVWRGNILIGGLYGVLVDGVFCGESVYGTESNVAKYAFISAVEWLRSAGHEWMDVQMVTTLTRTFGAEYISRLEYLALIKQRQQD